MSSRDAIHPVKKKRCSSSKAAAAAGGGKEISFSQDFGLYQLCLLAVTQISYLPVAASILATSFMKMSKETCDAIVASRNASSSSAMTSSGINVTSSSPDDVIDVIREGEFYSLLSAWRLECTEQAQAIQTAISTCIMLGALIGAFLCGFLADRYGRKPVVIASLALLSLSNGVLLASSLVSWWTTLPVFFVMGGACGGYMTTNLVLVVESLCRPSSRLLVVALNGWSLSMAGTALLAWMCPHWFQYHAAIAAISFICGGVLLGVADESLRWLKSARKEERFDRASDRLARFNQRDSVKDVVLVSQLEQDEAAARPLIAAAEGGEGGPRSSISAAGSLSYLDLFAERSLRPRLLALAYCFFCSSVVSFGFYFAFDSLSGNRYVNMACGGAGKFLLGLLPFVVSSCVSRKQVALISVAAAAAAAWTVLACLFAGLPFQSTAITALSLVATASLDPTWKISHLYSTELFPTSMRNMARGFCNSAARIGSVLAPLISHLRHEVPHVSYGMFALLLTGQLVVTALFLPQQPPSTLQDILPAAAAPTAAAAEAGEGRRRQQRQRREEEDDDARSHENSSQVSETAPLTP